MLAADVASPIDVPPFDRALVDGFALRAADTQGADASAPRRLKLNQEILACGVAPRIAVAPGTATPIATGGVLPRGADAVVMVETTEFVADGQGAIDCAKAAGPGQLVAMPGPTWRSAKRCCARASAWTAREIGMLGACGLATVEVVRRPRVGVLSTGDELVAPGSTLPAAGIYDSNGAIVAASVAENGGEAIAYGIVRDDETALEAAIRTALSACDLVVLSGRNVEGRGRRLAPHPHAARRAGHPRPRRRPQARQAALPGEGGRQGGRRASGLPDLRDVHLSRLRSAADPGDGRVAAARGDRRRSRAAAAPGVGTRPDRVRDGLAVAERRGLRGPAAAEGVRLRDRFSQADGFFAVPAARSGVEAGERVAVTRLGAGVRPPDLTLIGSHCLGLDLLVGRLAERGFTARTIWVGSSGGLAALRRGECDLAAMHLLDPETGRYNAPFLTPGLGWRRAGGACRAWSSATATAAPPNLKSRAPRRTDGAGYASGRAASAPRPPANGSASRWPPGRRSSRAYRYRS